MLSSKNIQTPSILGQVAALTLIRDIELFEISFIKTLTELLTVTDIFICKFDNNNTPYRLLHYVAEDESIQIQQEGIEVPKQITTAKNAPTSVDQVSTFNENNLYQTVFTIHGLKGIVGYLLIILPNPLSATDTLIISSLLNIAHNFHSLLEENQRDKLTGLLNRKTFDDNISKIQGVLNTNDLPDDYMGAEKRHHDKTTGHQFWLAILDIDHFKRVNDVFGHIYGDEVLLLLSQLMKKSFRSNDLLFRFGGEEFVVIVQVDTQQIAEMIFERFRKTIEDYDFPQVGKVTISSGASQIIDKYAIGSDIVGKADLALYHAKKTGRNRLYFYENLIKSGVLKEVIIKENDVEMF